MLSSLGLKQLCRLRIQPCKAVYESCARMRRRLSRCDTLGLNGCGLQGQGL